MTTITKTLNCENHGDYEVRYFEMNTFGKQEFSIGSTECPKCKEEREAQEAAKREEANKRAYLDYVKRCVANMQKQTPKRFQNACFDNYICSTEGQKSALKICKSYCEKFDSNIRNSGGGLVLSGNVGTGKTHLAISVGKELAKQGVHTYYKTLSDLVREVRSTWNGEGHEEFVYKKYRTCGLLIIDEVGVQVGSDNERNIIFEIIDGRYQDILPTIISSNLEREKIAEMISERSLDRITQGGAFIPFTWKSERASL